MLHMEIVGVRDGEGEGVTNPTVGEPLMVATGEEVGDPPVAVPRDVGVGKGVMLLMPPLPPPPPSPPIVKEGPKGVFVGAWGVALSVWLTEREGARGVLLRVGPKGLAEGEPEGEKDAESLPFPFPGVPVLKKPPPLF